MSKKKKTYIYYDAKADFLEVLERRVETTGEDRGDGYFTLLDSRDREVGFAIVEASKRLNEIRNLDPLLRFAVTVRIARMKRGLTQTEMADRMGVGLLQYQRLESADNNPTLRTILRLRAVLPEVSVDRVAS